MHDGQCMSLLMSGHSYYYLADSFILSVWICLGDGSVCVAGLIYSRAIGSLIVKHLIRAHHISVQPCSAPLWVLGLDSNFWEK